MATITSFRTDQTQPDQDLRTRESVKWKLFAENWKKITTEPIDFTIKIMLLQMRAAGQVKSQSLRGSITPVANRWNAVFLACCLTAAGASNGHVDPKRHTDKPDSSFPRVPSSGVAGCGGLGSRGEFYFYVEEVRKLTDKLTRAFQAAILLLLAAILAVQVSILMILPPKLPTIGEFQHTQGDQQRLVAERIPCIRVVSGSVEVSGPVDVNVENTPLEVEIVNN